MKSTTHRLALTIGLAASLVAPLAAHANVFGTGNNGVYAEQQRVEKDKEKDKGGGGSPYQTPPGQPQAAVNQVPEPETLSLLAIGLVAAWAASRRRKD